MPLGGESTGRARDPHAASARAAGRRPRHGAVRLADGARARRSVLDVRSSRRTTCRRCPFSLVQAHLLPYYEDFAGLLERARPGSTSQWPPTRTAAAGAARARAHRGARCAELFKATPHCAPRRARSSNAARLSGRDVSRRWKCCSICTAGTSSRYLNFYGRRARFRRCPTIGARGVGRRRRGRGRSCSSGCRSRVQPRAAGRFHLGLFGEHRDQLERRRGRCDRVGESARATHAARPCRYGSTSR